MNNTELEFEILSLKTARINAGYIQTEAAKEIGISKGALASYENYKTSPDIATAKRIAEVYKRPLDRIKWL